MHVLCLFFFANLIQVYVSFYLPADLGPELWDCSYYRIQILQGLFILWKTGIAILVHSTASSTVVLQNIDIAGLVHITEYRKY